MRDPQPILDVNTVSRDQLLERGLLPEIAERIIRRREAQGPFRDETDLYEVVRDNEIRMDQLLGIVGLPPRDNPQGYSS